MHASYRRARKEYRRCLHEVVAFHNPGAGGEIERQCQHLLSLLR